MIPKTIKQNWMMAEVVLGIRNYEVTGEVLDNGWLYANRELLESALRDDMRSKNILPVLDMPTKLSCSFNIEKNIFEFAINAAGYQMENIENFIGIIVREGVIVDSDFKKALLCEGL